MPSCASSVLGRQHIPEAALRRAAERKLAAPLAEQLAALACQWCALACQWWALVAFLAARRFARQAVLEQDEAFECQAQARAPGPE